MPVKLKHVKLTVEPEFPVFARKCEKLFNFQDRREYPGAGGDALLLEYELARSGYAQEPLNWRHDVIYYGKKIDCKEINSEYFNIHHGKTEQYMESIIMGELTHFLFWKSDRPRDRELEAGEIVNVDILALCDARRVIKERIKSTYRSTEAYVPLETLQILDEGLYI